MFTKNIGSAERIVRALAGLAILSLFFLYPDAGWRYWTLLGLVPLATAVVGWCPPYAMLGINTCRADKA